MYVSMNIMQSVVMLNIMLSVVMLIVIAPVNLLWKSFIGLARDM
jgi:hypothetical protein